MSVWYDYKLEVLATSPEEMGSITARLRRPSNELVEWLAQRKGIEPSECVDDVAKFVAFDGGPHPSHTNATNAWFHNSFKNWTGLVNSHIHEVSKEFPSAAFLLGMYGESQFANRVIIGGEIIAESCDSNQHAQALDWCLIDIFRPFRAEHQSGLPFGSLWDEWLDDISAEVDELRAADERWWLSLHAKAKGKHNADGDQSCPDALDLTFGDDVPAPVPMPNRPKHLIVREMHNGTWRTLCNVCHQPIPVTTLQSLYESRAATRAPQCFEVTPCNVGVYQHDEKPREHVERWRKQPGKVVVCAECWSRLCGRTGLVPPQHNLSQSADDPAC